LLIWGALLFLLFRIAGMEDEISRRLSDGEQVIGAASVYKSHPDSSSAAGDTAQPGMNAFTIVSDVLDSIGIVGTDRRPQFEQNSSGVQVKLDRLYGSELRDFFTSVEKQGVRVRTAEVRAMSVRDTGRLLYLVATFEQGER
ncbi:MAG: hypothetical protein LBS93_06725, partial [Synergistaceae bacterium]|nr:hypothetical protein [Synergistaceae bacterium]